VKRKTNVLVLTNSATWNQEEMETLSEQTQLKLSQKYHIFRA
jgi:hypothetical protein